MSLYYCVHWVLSTGMTQDSVNVATIQTVNTLFVQVVPVGLVLRRAIGIVNVPTVSQCVHLFCNYSGPACPSSASPGTLNYVLLGSYQDDQCLNDMVVHYVLVVPTTNYQHMEHCNVLIVISVLNGILMYCCYLTF